MIDFLIIGHGLAGAILAWRLIERGQLGEFFGTQFFKEQPLVRTFSSMEEKGYWRNRNLREEYSAYLQNRFDEIADSYHLLAPLGGFYQSSCGRLDVALLLKSLKRFFKSLNCFECAAFTSNDWEKTTAGFLWRGQLVKKWCFASHG